MIRYAITDGSRFGTGFEVKLEGLLHDALRWANAHVDFVQLREKDLNAGHQLHLAKAMLEVLRTAGGNTRLLINGRADVALAAGADGVHLSSGRDELTVAQARSLFPADIVISASCHTRADIVRLREADILLFGPIFQKRIAGRVVAPGLGLSALQQACAAAGKLPLLALGGVDQTNLTDCLNAGAAGIAAIRLFQ